MGHTDYVAIVYTLTLSCMLAGGRVSAQSALESDEMCEAEVAPQQLDAGLSAVQARVRLPAVAGDITGLDPGDGTGIRLASAERLRRLFGSPEGEPSGEPKPIEANPDSQWTTLWLDLFRAEPGTHTLAVDAEGMTCIATISVR